jgi:isopenicillin N synthase-like dioxygenase
MPVTKEDLDLADLVTLDLSDIGNPGGKVRLAAQLKDAIQNDSFFYLINLGLSPDEVNEQFQLAEKPFQILEEEKIKCKTNASLPGRWCSWIPTRSGVRSQPLLAFWFAGGNYALGDKSCSRMYLES